MGKLSATFWPVHRRRAGGPDVDAGAHRRGADLYPGHPRRGNSTRLPAGVTGSQMLVHGGEGQLRGARSERSDGAAAVAAPSALRRSVATACAPRWTATRTFTL